MDLVCAAVGLSSTSDDMPPAPVRIIACRRSSWRSRYRRRQYHRARWAAQMPRDAAEQLLVGTGWLPGLMRTPQAAQRARRPPAGDAGHVFRRRRVIGVAGTLHAVPACHRAGAKSGQSHDAQAFDRARCGKPDTFPPEAGREGRLMPSAHEPARGAARRRRESRNDEKKSPNPAKLRSLADLRIFLVRRACDVTMAAAEVQYSAIVLGATGNVGGRIVQHLI